MTFQKKIDTALAANNLSDALGVILEHFGADAGTIHLLEADGVLHLKAASAGIPAQVLDAVRLVPVGKGLAGMAVERKEPVTVCNLQSDSGSGARPGAKATGMEGAIVVPILAGEQAIGALGIGNRVERTFTEEETSHLMRLGRAIAERQRS
jgi:signal transduction protein with GAF and PtsI domain